jgi:hypothetical protein
MMEVERMERSIPYIDQQAYKRTIGEQKEHITNLNGELQDIRVIKEDLENLVRTMEFKIAKL